MNNIKIKHIDSGYLVKHNGETNAFHVGEELDLLNFLLDAVDGRGSRYDAERIYIIKAPGDKHDNFSDAHAEIIWGKDE